MWLNFIGQICAVNGQPGSWTNKKSQTVQGNIVAMLLRITSGRFSMSVIKCARFLVKNTRSLFIRFEGDKVLEYLRFSMLEMGYST